MKNLETERLFLKPISKPDASFILELYNSATFIKFIGDKKIRSLEDAENYITEKFLPQLERLGYGNYLVVRKSDEKKIGAVGIFERKGLDVQDIGFSFLDEFQGKGYGFESASKLLEIAFSEFNLNGISAITSKENIASQNLIKKLGLKYLKTVQLPNEDVELLYFELSKTNT
ncbi:GNAT family acetyltransferase [Kaistella jeonii]|uniref:GNAT family acetyltransferase n=1 Tax=Kaistella jeonii TaxID=266749 RepID=A0A0C1FAU4_9FLAO|nr:GNAT family acetyltransferase [Kaistella jeonii]